MKTLKFFLLSITLFLGYTSAKACDCETTNSPKEAYDKVDIVFAGTVTDIIEGEGSVKVVFRTITAWKGVSDTTVILDAGYSSCDWTFFKGNHYVVYGYGVAGAINTNLCTRTATLFNASEDLQFLAAKEKLYDSRGTRSDGMCFKWW